VVRGDAPSWLSTVIGELQEAGISQTARTAAVTIVASQTALARFAGEALRQLKEAIFGGAAVTAANANASPAPTQPLPDADDAGAADAARFIPSQAEPHAAFAVILAAGALQTACAGRAPEEAENPAKATRPISRR
jgi:hypothetical protein